MKVVICGGGIMGCSTAFHLAKKGVPSVMVERHSVACGASGKAGGFLAQDWCDHFEVGPLARASFALHMELSETFDSDYRRVDTLQVEVASAAAAKPRKQGKAPEWVDGNVKSVDVMGTRDTTAQVHPRKLCEAFLAAARALVEVELVHGCVEGFVRDGARVTGVRVQPADGELRTLAADAVAVTMGPWSGRALEMLGLPPLISGRRAHGLVLQPASAVSAHALFSEVIGGGSAEVYPRPDGTVYMCGMSDDEVLPDAPDQVKVDAAIAARIRTVGGKVASVLAAAEVVREQACYMPTSRDGLPVIGSIRGAPGAFIAAGHSCWGILNGPATGKALADLMVDGQCSWLDLKPFDPQRFLS